MDDLYVERSADPSKYPMWNPLRKSEMEGKLFTRDFAMGKMLQKAADSFSVGPLIRQDLEPDVYQIFVKKFPFYEMLKREEANGLVHAYNRQTAYSQFSQDVPLSQQENAVVTDDTNQYQRETTNIAIFAARRGASLKSLYAVRAGGAPFGDPAVRELDGGTTKIAHDVQAEFFRFNASTSVGTSGVNTDPNGLYDPNGLNGLRWTLNNLPYTNPSTGYINSFPVNVTSAGWTDNRVIRAVRAAANSIIDAGGTPDIVIGSTTGIEQLISDTINQARFMYDTNEVIPGFYVPRVVAGESQVNCLKVPGDSVGQYLANPPTVGPFTSPGAGTYSDLYVADSSTLSIPWLGSAMPTVLEIPIGVDGTLRKLYIPFLMVGLAIHAPQFLARVQLRIA